MNSTIATLVNGKRKSNSKPITERIGEVNLLSVPHAGKAENPLLINRDLEYPVAEIVAGAGERALLCVTS
jgi:hypothetical protein